MQNVTDFIARWKAIEPSENANPQLFLSELCNVLGLRYPESAPPDAEIPPHCPAPGEPADHKNHRVELDATFLHQKSYFILATHAATLKDPSAARSSVPGPGFAGFSHSPRGCEPQELGVRQAKRHAEMHVKCLSPECKPPPFLIVIDAGYCIHLFADFSRTGGPYLHFPDAKNRITLDDLATPEVQSKLTAIWNDPMSLDPSLRNAKATENMLTHFVNAAALLVHDGHKSQVVGRFALCCLFAMFAEIVGLLPNRRFTTILSESLGNSNAYMPKMRTLFDDISNGRIPGLSPHDGQSVTQRIFADVDIIPLQPRSLAELLKAAQSDFRHVELSIFGSVLVIALEANQRRRLGAHFTPRSYADRLVVQTVIRPLRAEWDNVTRIAECKLRDGHALEACETVRAFHERLARTRILDPACGSGNFLYVAIEHMIQLEHEVLEALAAIGPKQPIAFLVGPHQFLGLEASEITANVADAVLWFAYLRCQNRSCSSASSATVISGLGNIQCRDAVLNWNPAGVLADARDRQVCLWGDDAPTVDSPADFSPHRTGYGAGSADLPYAVSNHGSAADWPDADFVVGNPPFVGGKDKQKVLGREYFNALFRAYPTLPESCDFSMYWWHKAAELVRSGIIRRFGFITTNSISQLFNRRILTHHMQATPPIHLVFAVHDHPWNSARGDAAVRISMTVAEIGSGPGVLATVTEERPVIGREVFVDLEEKRGIIHENLQIGVDLASALALKSNSQLCTRGVTLHGSGFVVTPSEATELGLGRIPGLDLHIRPYLNGKDLAGKTRGLFVIDLHGLSAQQVQSMYPDVYQWLHTRVKPERDKNREQYRRKNWWLFGRKNTELRGALQGLPRYISTVETAKHRFFVFLPADVLPDNSLVNIASSDAYHLGVLSSRFHVCFALAAGGTLGSGPRYTKSTCFDTFPFPAASVQQQDRIRQIAENLDSHRKECQAKHPSVTLTGIYNVHSALRANRPLSASENKVNNTGIVSVLRELHDALDSAVADAYGFPEDICDENALYRLVALNAERSNEENQSKVRWLRPEFQNLDHPTDIAADRKSIPGPKQTLSQSGSDFGDSDDDPVEESLYGDDNLPMGEAQRQGRDFLRLSRYSVPTPFETRPDLPLISPADISPWPSNQFAQVRAVREIIAFLRAHRTEVTVDLVAKYFHRGPKKRIADIISTLQSLGMDGFF